MLANDMNGPTGHSRVFLLTSAQRHMPSIEIADPTIAPTLFGIVAERTAFCALLFL